MKYKITIVLLTCFSAHLFSQAYNGKDLVFKVRSERTTVTILPNVAWIDDGDSQSIGIHLKPAGRRIGQVTFKGGEIKGKDSCYTLIPGNGTEGILSVYVKTATGNKLIASKVYPFRKINTKKRSKMADHFHVCSLGCMLNDKEHHPNYRILYSWGIEKAMGLFVAFNNTSENAARIKILRVIMINWINQISRTQATCSVLFKARIATPGSGTDNKSVEGELTANFQFGKNAGDEWILTGVMSTSKIKANNDYLTKFIEQAQNLKFRAE